MDYGQRLVHLVDAAYAQQENEDGMRKHLGASVLGEKCMRQLWLEFRWAGSEQFDGRMLRLFARGNREEHVITNLLRRVGADVWTSAEATTSKQQAAFRVSALGGHMGGTMDGVACNLPDLPPYVEQSTPVLLEMKTHCEKQFALLKSKGLKEAHPKHYRQATTYMHHSGIKYCLYCAVNKNTDELWFYFFELDVSLGIQLTQRGEAVIFNEGTPPRISETPSWHECRFCSVKDICFGNKMPRVTCRSCIHAKPERAGHWSCGRFRKEIETQPKQGCELHCFHPMLLPHVHATAFDGERVTYQYRGQPVVNGPGATSSECIDLTR